MSPQRGQATPSDQRSFSRYSRQVSSSRNFSIKEIRLVLEVSTMGHTRRKKDKLPKDVRHLTGDQVMEKLFSKRVAKELKKIADEKDRKAK